MLKRIISKIGATTRNFVAFIFGLVFGVIATVVAFALFTPIIFLHAAFATLTALLGIKRFANNFISYPHRLNRYMDNESANVVQINSKSGLFLFALTSPVTASVFSIMYAVVPGILFGGRVGFTVRDVLNHITSPLRKLFEEKVEDDLFDFTDDFDLETEQPDNLQSFVLRSQGSEPVTHDFNARRKRAGKLESNLRAEEVSESNSKGNDFNYGPRNV